jgi:hypothetical protein
LSIQTKNFVLAEIEYKAKHFNWKLFLEPFLLGFSALKTAQFALVGKCNDDFGIFTIF